MKVRTQLMVNRMERTFQGTYVLVFSGSYAKFPVSSSKGLLPESCHYKCYHWGSLRHIVLPLSRSANYICTRYLKSVLWFVSGKDWNLGLAEGVWVGHWVVSIVDELPLKGESFSYLLRGKEF